MKSLKKLVNLGGCVHIFDEKLKRFIPLNSTNVTEAITNINWGERDAFENRQRKDVIKVFKIIYGDNLS